MPVITTLRATTADELADIEHWFCDSWIDAATLAHDPTAATVTGSFEQAPDHDGVERARLPSRELLRSTPLFREFKRPLVQVRLLVHKALAVEWHGLAGPIWGVSYDDAEHRIVFDSAQEIRIAVTDLDVTLEVTDEVTGWERLRLGRAFGWESVSPWPG